jgi:hypothetical protein
MRDYVMTQFYKTSRGSEVAAQFFKISAWYLYFFCYKFGIIEFLLKTNIFKVISLKKRRSIK